jgi:hypothetical protein
LSLQAFQPPGFPAIKLYAISYELRAKKGLAILANPFLCSIGYIGSIGFIC